MAAPRWLRLLRSSTHVLVRVALGVMIVVSFIAHELGWFSFDLVQRLEHIAYDSRLRLFAPRTVDPKIVIVDIDERSLTAEGRWPWDRKKMATLTRNLFDTYKIKVLGFDVLFGEPDTSSGISVLNELATGPLKNNTPFNDFMAGARPKLDYDQLFAAEIAKNPVVLGIFIGDTQNKSGALPQPTFRADQLGGATILEQVVSGYTGNLPIFQNAAAGAGHMYPDLDDDGIVRRVPMLSRIGDNYYDSLSLAVLRIALNNPPVVFRPPVRANDAAIDLGEVTIPVDLNISAWVPYRGSRGSFPYVSATDVLRGKADANLLRDKIALVGASAQGLVDLRATPVQADLPGVEIHANLISGALNHRILQRPDYEFGFAVGTLIVVGLALALVLPLQSPLHATLITLAVIALTTGVNLYLWSSHHFVVRLAVPLLLVISLYFLNMAYGFFTESRAKRMITARFGEYIPKELVDEMAKDPSSASMEGEEREMTVLFSDVRNFTTISEGLPANELSRLMNAYLTPMTQVIQGQRGTIDKYIGDAIMCFWGAPLPDHDHAKHGVTAALGMQTRIKELWPEFEKNGWPRLEIGVGLNTGPMRVGNMGSQFRRAYTVMGDAVNVGSRLEGLTKEYGIGVMASESVVNAAPDFVYREIDRIRVKGKLEPLAVYEPLGRGGEVPNVVLDEIDLFHRSLDRYREQRWDDAEMLLMRALRMSPETKLYKMFQKRIVYLRANPPGANWDGVWTFVTK